MLRTIAWALTAQVAAASWSVSNGIVNVVSRGVSIHSSSFPLSSSLVVPKESALEIEFDAGRAPHQAMAVLTDPSTGLEFGFSASSVRANGHARIVVPAKAVPQALRNVDLELEVVVGSVEQRGERVTVAQHVTVVADAPARSAPAPSQIFHQFRPEPRQVHWIFALGTSGAVIAVLVAGLAACAMVGNLGGLLPAVSKSWGHLGFVGGLVAFEVVVVWYYLGRSIFETLGSVLVLGPVLVFCGSRALRSLEL